MLTARLIARKLQFLLLETVFSPVTCVFKGHYKEGVSVTALREIKLLQEIKHQNVIVRSSSVPLAAIAMDADFI
jgi:hypothetical protein